MKKLLSVGLFVVLFVTRSQAQEEYPIVIVDRMHLAPGVSDKAYVEFEGLYQRLHQKSVDGGVMQAWYLNRVDNGGRTQYITSRVYSSLAQLEKELPESTWEGVLNEDEQRTAEALDETRQVISSEMWQLAALAMPTDRPAGEAEGASPHIRVDYMKVKPGKGAAYFEMETELFRKLHQARIEAGDMSYWMLMWRRFPRGDDMDWDFATINVHPNEEAAGATNWVELVNRVLSAEERESMPDVEEVRTIVRSEFWHGVLKTNP